MNLCFIRARAAAGFAAALLAPFLLGVGALAQEADTATRDFYLTGGPVAQGGAMPVSRVNLYQAQKRSYLFVPGFWNLAALHPQYSAKAYPELLAGSSKADSVALESGAATSAFAAPRLTLRRGNGAILGNVEVLQGSHIPCIFIQTDSGALQAIHKSKDTLEGGQMVMYNPDGSVRYQGGLTQIRVRGNTTIAYSKKPYQIKLADKAGLLGLDKAKTWALLADYLDLTLLRNRITLDLAKAIGLRFAVDCQSVDLYINGDYMGVYLLTDKVQINPGRVDIQDPEAEMEFRNDKPLDSYPSVSVSYPDGSSYKAFLLQHSPQDITGGFLLEAKKAFRVRRDGLSYVFTQEGMGILVAEPKIVSEDQIQYLHGLLTAFDRGIRAPDGVDPVTSARYDALFDMRSMAQKFLIEEFTQNFDAKAGSQYFYKDSSALNPKVYAGPGWDYDLTYANCMDSDPSRGYLMNMPATFPWYNTLYQKQEAFRQLVHRLYWTQFRPAAAALVGLEPGPNLPAIRPLPDYIRDITPSAEMNFARWPPSTIKGYNRRMGTRFSTAHESLLDFIRRRVDALDRLFAP